jgi:two-component system cell cycle response regulator
MTARVLVVDDVAANVKLLEARLSAEYFDVITAMSGEQALAICERAECDLVLLDVMMPDSTASRCAVASRPTRPRTTFP